ncbi:MAG: XTP/dITP diphosphatase [Halobacteriota archaeon]|nr:XTP/dITP diphosphatase [Halobacteriota archaeon]
MRNIYFVTGNTGKVKEVLKMAPPEMEIEQIDYDYPEIQVDELEQVASHGAKHSSEFLKKPIIVEDSGLFVDVLDGFPGPYSAYVFKKIGNEGILKLMAGEKDRGATFKSVVGYCEPGGNPLLFVGSVDGKISEEIRGKHGFGYDPIFSTGESTFAEMGIEKKNEVSHRRRAFEAFLSWFIEGSVDGPDQPTQTF